jgi:hypothetical protein
MGNWKAGVIAVVQHAISKNDSKWGKQLASFLENQAKDLRLVFGPSGTAHRVPIGLKYMEPTAALAMVAAYKYAASNPGADEESIVAGSASTVYEAAGAKVVKATVYDAKQVLRWVRGVRSAAAKTGFPGTECKTLVKIPPYTKATKPHTFTVIL